MTKYLLVEVHRYIHRYDNIEIRIRMIREPFVYGRQVSGERREARGERREEVGLLNDIRVFCMTKTTSHKSHIIRVLLVDSKSRLSVSILLVPLSLSLSLSRAFSLSLSLSLSVSLSHPMSTQTGRHTRPNFYDLSLWGAALADQLSQLVCRYMLRIVVIIMYMEEGRVPFHEVNLHFSFN